MPQRRLEVYFSVPLRLRTQGTKSSLDLPYSVRHQIYILAGLVRFCPINLNQEGLREVFHLGDENSPCFYHCRRFHGKFYNIDSIVTCGCPHLPCSLLYVSKAVSREAVSILYSENKFTVFRNECWGLKPLQNLSKEALAALRSLTIRLNNGSCVYGNRSFPHCETPPCHRLCEMNGFHDRPIGNQARQDKVLLKIWYDLVSLLASHISPGLVNLSVICDTKDRDTTYQVLAPFSQFPLLKDCSIRLGKNPNWELHNLARTQTLKLIGQPMDLAPKPYSYQLPEEIIERILGHTDLIAPFDLEWLPNKGLVPFDCCKECINTLDCCSCSFYHASYSSTCTCWRLPTSIFLTSHTVHRIATALFYSMNKFLLFPNGVGCWHSCRIPTSLQSPLARFIEVLPGEALAHLRHVTLNFPDFEQKVFLQDEKNMAEWRNAIYLLARKVDLPKLTLILDIGETLNAPSPVPSNAQNLEAYERILQPLISVRRIRNFFVFLRGGWSQEFVCILEESIMGQDYDAVANGKLQEKRRLWNDGYSLEGPVIGPDRRTIWPPAWWSHAVAYESSSEQDER